MFPCGKKVEFDYSFKAIFNLNILLKKFNATKDEKLSYDIFIECCNVLGIDHDDKLLSEVIEYVFYDKRHSFGGNDQTLDFEQHYDIIWSTFKMQGINLNVDDITWWEFAALLESFMLVDTLPVTKLVSKLSEKPPKATKDNGDYLRGLANFKLRYGIKTNVSDGLGNMFSGLKSIAKNGK